jgi:hypothetical protein
VPRFGDEQPPLDECLDRLAGVVVGVGGDLVDRQAPTVTEDHLGAGVAQP